MHEIKNVKIAPEGKSRIEWADSMMPVLRLIRKRFSREKPLQGTRIAACLHVTSETANLIRALRDGGALVRLCASNPLSTQDEVAASLVKDYGIEVFAIKNEDRQTYYKHIGAALEINPHITMDDGADLVSTIHSDRMDLASEVHGGTEETTTGVIRLRSMAKEGVLKYPIIAVNDANTKHLFDNRYGTGQSTIDGILRATNVLLAGSVFVVCGYGWCGRGIAMRARGMGAKVIVCEVNPLKALEAAMDGWSVMPLLEASHQGDIFVTSTGNKNVIGKPHFEKMKDGVIVANAGHFNVEINLEDLERLSVQKRTVRKDIREFKLKGGKRINLLGEGRLVNLACAEGHPSLVMDMSFANQALCCEYLINKGKELEKRVYRVPKEIDERVARQKLNTMGIKIDSLSQEQREYITSWRMGT
ncbi:MAG: adenosylhomocysteinase [bacterium]